MTETLRIVQCPHCGVITDWPLEYTPGPAEPSEFPCLKCGSLFLIMRDGEQIKAMKFPAGYQQKNPPPIMSGYL